MKNRSVNLKSRLVKKAINVNNKLQKLDYRHCTDTANSDINALFHPGKIVFRDAKPFFAFIKEIDLLVKMILQEK